MSKRRFSKKYRTYGGWLKTQPGDSKYAKEIIRKNFVCSQAEVLRTSFIRPLEADR